MVVPQKNMKILKRYTSKPVRTQIFTEKKKDWTSLEDNYVIVDPDEKYIETVSKLLKKNGYKVQVLNLKEPKKSVHYNPFVYEFNAMKIQHMVDALLENTKSKKDADTFDVPTSFFSVNNNMRLHSCCRILSYGKDSHRSCSGCRIPVHNRWRRHNSHSCCGHRPEYRCREEYRLGVLPSLFSPLLIRF